MNRLISVIVPAYNASTTIWRCLDSIINQTYHNLEILVINDGSTDATGDIIEEYAEKDSRIICYHTKNSGVSSARNLGLDCMKGEYFTFIDSDDFVSNRYIEGLYTTMMKFSARMAVCGRYDTYDARHVERLEERTPVWGGQKILVNKWFDYTKEYATRCVTRTLIDSELVKDIRFDSSIHNGEDTLFVAQIIQKCDAIAYNEEKLYYYIERPESLFHGEFDDRKYSAIHVSRKLCELFKDRPFRFKCGVHFVAAHICHDLLSRKGEKKKEQFDSLVSEYRKHLLFLPFSNISLKMKCKMFLQALMPRTAIYLRDRGGRISSIN